MVAQRRFGPLVALVCAGFALLVARLFQVQVLEHEVWAGQAAILVRSSKVVPYKRGDIEDRDGRTLVQDEEVYELSFCYRDFRRGHPLAAVAHARSTLEMRAVSLGEALSALVPWARALVELSPAALDLFERGAALAASGVPASADPEADLRPRRASDLRYYVGELLDVASAERKELRPEPESAERELSYVALLARARAVAPETLLAALERRLAGSREHLVLLADLLKQDLALGDAAVAPLEALLAILERQRELVEDASADELFEQAAGFAPGRVRTRTLERAFDVGWIAKLLRWDSERTLRWIQSRRALHLRDLETRALPRILVAVGLEQDESMRPERLLADLAGLYVPASVSAPARGAPPRSWTELAEPCVLAEIPRLFELPRRPRDIDPSAVVLPLQDEDVRAVAGEIDDPWLAVGMVTELAVAKALSCALAPEPIAITPGEAGRDLASGAPRTAQEAAARWRRLADSSLRVEGESALLEIGFLATALEACFSNAVDQMIERVLVESEEQGVAGPLPFAEARLDRALQQEKFIQKDKSNRPVVLRSEPGHPLVRLLGRYPERYPGFDVRETTRRLAVARDPDGVPVAARLVGSVRKPSVRELFAQVRDEVRLAELQYKVLRSREDTLEIKDLAARLYRSDEWTGGSGVEDYFDRELRGRFGYHETQGLQQRDERAARAIFEAPENGLEVTLTLDLGLQLAAQATLSHPELPRDPKIDPLWFEHPIGAIVLMTLDGEVLAAASEPTVDGHPRTPGRNTERAVARERTLRRPTFNPPGSVFKPFVAAFALDQLGFDPRREFHCAPDEAGKGGRYETMHCHGVHYDCDLHRALSQSCNAYFAQLGEWMAPDKVLEMAALFGFGEATGIRQYGDLGRGGLGEDWKLAQADQLPTRLADRANRMRFTNGLGLIEATPMQVARATAGLVSGRLPEVRIARAIGGVPVPRAARDLALSERSRRFVLDALMSAVDEPVGTAYGKGLDRATLGFGFACKTGSADAWTFRESPEMTAHDREALAAGKMRKHTWVAGFFPREAPKAVLVVYLHDVSETASHTSVYVAAQFLRSEAVRRFAEAATGSAAAGDR